jgi:hypothetical protein
MMETHAMVFVVDDDAPVRESLKNLIRSFGLRTELFSSAFPAAKLPLPARKHDSLSLSSWRPAFKLMRVNWPPFPLSIYLVPDDLPLSRGFDAWVRFRGSTGRR